METTTVNGINTEALRATVEAIKTDPAKGMTHWEVTTYWRGGTRSDTHVTRFMIGGEEVAKDFTIKALKNPYPRQIKSVKMVGVDGVLPWRVTDDGLHIERPDTLPCEHAYAFKIERG